MQKEPVLEFQKNFILTYFLWSVKNTAGHMMFFVCFACFKSFSFLVIVV